MAYVHFIAGFTLQFAYADFVVVGCHSMVFGSGLLLYRIHAFEHYLDVCLFKEVGDFSDFGTMICEDGPFIVFVVCFVHVGFVLSISSVLLPVAAVTVYSAPDDGHRVSKTCRAYL